MKNKTTILLTAFFISTCISLNARSEKGAFLIDGYTCWDVADETVDAFRQANVQMRQIATHEAEFRVWEAAYLTCMDGN